MDEIKNLLKSITIILFGALIITGGFLYATQSYTIPLSEQTPKVLTVYFFYGEECPHCHNTMPFIQGLIDKYPDVEVKELEVWHNETNRNLSTKMLADLGQTSPGVPLVIVGDIVLVGSKEIPDKLEGIILNKTGRNNG
jgi:thiol-disulfide isomerase/thioredoxin